jgi:uncharacterized membrane protein YccC
MRQIPEGTMSAGRSTLQRLPGADLRQLITGLRWLYAPDPVMFGYALRTTFSSLLALGIALWMELGSPQWAALTVWMIAQGTRGRSLAKARWHLFGMVLGVIFGVGLVAAFPQAPMLFIVALACGIGLFCMIGTFLPGPATMTNYRIHGMRATGFTYAIVSLDGIADPGHIFRIAASRATYILLGIVLETTISGLFQLRLVKRTRAQLADNFETALSGSIASLCALLDGQKEALSTARSLFTTITTLGDQVEFAEVELGRATHAGDHARAALADIAILLARGFDVATLMRVPLATSETFNRQAHVLRDFLQTVPDRLRAEPDASKILDDLRALRRTCRHDVTDALAAETEHPAHFDPHTPDAAHDSLVRQAMLHHALIALIDALRMALMQFDASRVAQPHDHFRAPIRSYRNWPQAAVNSARAAVTVFGAGLIWMTTAWPDGLTFLMFVSIACSLFSTLERPALATKAFFHGACCAALAGGVLDLALLGTPTTFELLAFWTGIAMLLGGLAFAYPPLTLPAVAYNLFLPIMIGPANSGRTNEITYFNTALPLVLGLAYATWMFRVFLPYNVRHQRQAMRAHILHDLRRTARARTPPDTDDIVSRNVDRFVRLLTNAGNTPAPIIETYLGGILSAMRVALWVRRLRAIRHVGLIPPPAQRAIGLVIGRMSHFSGRYSGHYGRTLRATRLAIARLRTCERMMPQLRTRVALVAALTGLDIIAAELDENRAFFDTHNEAPENSDAGTL